MLVSRTPFALLLSLGLLLVGCSGSTETTDPTPNSGQDPAPDPGQDDPPPSQPTPPPPVEPEGDSAPGDLETGDSAPASEETVPEANPNDVVSASDVHSAWLASLDKSECEAACKSICDAREAATECDEDRQWGRECTECSDLCPKGSVPRYLLECSKASTSCGDFDTCIKRYDPEAGQ